jgi:hypothetical protein
LSRVFVAGLFLFSREQPMSNQIELINAYLAGPAELRASVAGMSPEQLRARPVAGKWSALEVVCHLADFDPILAARMKRTIALDNPTLLGADENLFARSLAYHDRDVEEELALVEVTRRQMGRILASLPGSAFERVGTHNERGKLTLADLVGISARHIPHHVKFIREKRQALGLA